MLVTAVIAIVLIGAALLSMPSWPVYRTWRRRQRRRAYGTHETIDLSRPHDG